MRTHFTLTFQLASYKTRTFRATALVMEPLFTVLVTVSVTMFTLFDVFEMRYILVIWRAQVCTTVC